jgi:multiple sugar transport system permease protein
MARLAWRWLFDPSYSAINWILEHLGLDRISWLGETGWARFSVILANVWFGAPFFMIMYLASLKSVPEQLYKAASIDGATWWRRTRYVTLPMMRNIIAITVLSSLIGTFAAFDVVAVLTQVFATYAFTVGILSGDLPLGAIVVVTKLQANFPDSAIPAARC